MTNKRSITRIDVAPRLVALGIVTKEAAEEALGKVRDWADAPLEDGELAEVLVEFGVALAVYADDVDDLEESYRSTLEEAAACCGGPVVVSDVRLIRGAGGRDRLEFVRGGERVVRPAEHGAGRSLSRSAVFACLGRLAPGGADERTFHRVLPGEGAAADGAVYVLVTPGQAAALGAEFGLALEDRGA
ncbi:hypothetical protein ACGFOU_03460 [Streptomyces sp. NPDC048595]|uniref:hypothetical protein n=1 Tax=Streptomyces sp. NPDC048595 TaxID=3365576 RepID=UPI003724A59F